MQKSCKNNKLSANSKLCLYLPFFPGLSLFLSTKVWIVLQSPVKSCWGSTGSWLKKFNNRSAGIGLKKKRIRKMRMSLLIFLIFLSLSTILMKRPKQTLNLSLLTSIVWVAWGFLNKPRHSGFVLKNKNIRLLYIFSRLSQRLNATDGPWKENAETVRCWFGMFHGICWQYKDNSNPMLPFDGIVSCCSWWAVSPSSSSSSSS